MKKRRSVCLRCGYKWVVKQTKGIPKNCAKCHSRYWNIPRGQRPSHRPKRPVSLDGAELTKARIASGLSLLEVAERLKVHKSTVSRWERGEIIPTLESIVKLLVLYKIDGGVIKGLGGADGK